MKTKTIDKAELDGAFLYFKWTVSKGRDTYGYNICSLYINGSKVSSCNGGGYDMKGTALGDWVEKQFTEDLKTLEAHWEEGKPYIPCPKCKGKENRTDKLCPNCESPFGEIWNPDRKTGGLSGLTFVRDNAPYGTVKKWREGDKIHLDGAVGFECIKDILKAIGYDLIYLSDRSARGSDKYILRAIK